MVKRLSTSESRPYYGWWIVAGLFVVLMVSSGFGFYNLSVYMSVLAGARGFAIAEVSVAISLFFVVGGIAGMGVARLIDRYDVRWVMVAGALLGGAALGLTGYARSLWEIYLLFILFGIGNSAVSIITATTLVTRWFPGRDRSVALSVASTGLSAGGIVLTPLSARALNHLGLEGATPWFGLLFVVIIVPLAIWVLRARPGAALPGSASPDPLAPEWDYRAAVRTRFFLLLTLAYLLCMGAQVGGIAHLYNRAELIADYRLAATAIQALTFFSITGRFIGGWLVTRMSIRRFTLANLVGQAVGLTIIALAGGPLMVIIGAAVFGATVGNLLMLHPLWLADGFGVRAYPKIFSLSNALTVIGLAAGPALLGIVFDAFDYRWAYLLAASASILALAAMAAAGAGPRGARQPVVAAPV
jgi:MFS family permease